MPRGANEVVVILWRDIPAQVNGQAGRDRHQVLLSSKFQRAIDRAKRKARVNTAQEDIAQWRRISQPLAGDHEAAAEAEAERLEAEYSPERLGRLAFAGGWEAEADPARVPRAELLALEELSDDEGRADDPAARARRGRTMKDRFAGSRVPAHAGGAGRPGRPPALRAGADEERRARDRRPPAPVRRCR